MRLLPDRLLSVLIAAALIPWIGGCGGGESSSSGNAATSPSHANVLAQRQPVEWYAPTSVAAPATPPMKAARAAAGPTPSLVSLGEPTSVQKRAAQASSEPKPGTPHQTGFGRDIAPTADTLKTGALLHWQPAAQGGQIAAISFRSSSAQGVRLGLHVGQLPDSARLRFLAPAAASQFEVTGREVNAVIKRNLDAGDSADAARTYWAPHIEGNEATLEIELPAGVPPEALAVSVPRLAHFFGSPVPERAGSPERALAASCEVDVSCSGSSIESDATARMSYVDSQGDSYFCTGTLLNDRTSSGTPYFLSANHCISSQSAASSLWTYWFYRSASCNSATVNPSYRLLMRGATLLYSSASTDTAFMRLLDPAPEGARFAGWSPWAPLAGAQVTGIHHPRGDLQKISTGSATGFSSCTATNLFWDTFSCSVATIATGNFVNIVFTSGITESGSSGSGLFQTLGTSRYLVGQLRGGSSSCTNRSGSNYYGRFDLAYQAALSQWLDAAAPNTLSVRKTGSGGGLVWSLPAGIYCPTTSTSTSACSASYPGNTSVGLIAAADTGSAFTGWSGACSGKGACSVLMSEAREAVANFDTASSASALSSALDTTGLSWTTGGNVPFASQVGDSRYGGSAAQTGRISHNQSSTLSTVVAGPGSFTFDWKVSSEQDYDIFTVYLDGEAQYHWSGVTDWYTSTIQVPPGTHTIEWRYVKDNIYSVGQDAGWVDHVIFTPSAGTPSSADRIFNWAEAVYPSLFPRPGVAGVYQGYTYRYYAATGNYVATSNGRIVVHNGRDWLFKDVGESAGFLASAIAAGY